MRSLVSIGVAVLAVLGGCDKQKRGGPGGGGGGGGGKPVEQQLFVLREAVHAHISADRELAPVALVWIAEVTGPRGRAAVVWPAIEGTRVVDNDVVGLAFERTGAGWKPLGRETTLNSDGEARLKELLGEPLQIVWPDGLSVEEAGPFALATMRRFHQALEAGRSSEAVAAAEDFMRLLGPSQVVFDNDGVNILIEARFRNAKSLALTDLRVMGDGTHARASVQIDGKTLEGAVALVRKGTGWALGDVEDME